MANLQLAPSCWVGGKTGMLGETRQCLSPDLEPLELFRLHLRLKLEIDPLQ